jgi:sarcosine oxidase
VTDYRLAILGLGGIGSAAAYWASRRLGNEVVAIEQFELGHARGGSEDHSRIIRLSYHTPEYVDMARDAYRAWEQVEVDSGEPLVLRTGGLDLAPIGASIGLDSYRASMTATGVEFEELEADEVMRRWPEWRLEDGVSALFQPQSGIAMASRANAAHRRVARENGAQLMEGLEVSGIRENDGEIVFEVDGRVHRAGSLILAAGAWTGTVLHRLGVRFPLEVTLEQVVYMRPPVLSGFHPSRFPIWIWMDEPNFYGFPVFGEPAVKIAWDRCEIVTDPDKRSFVPREDVTEAVRRFAGAHLPGAIGPVHLAKTCLYTLTPDRDFIVDRVPGTEHIFTAVGAGHAFKFASLLGELLVELALDGVAHRDISAFEATRPILREADPARSYMV